ncbi:MAG: sulfur-oxidizing protein SoxA [Flavobacterium sp.]|jgi:sulfur-oxidizing protein SoxA
MNKYLIFPFACIVTFVIVLPVMADPIDDLAAMQDFFTKRFPSIELKAHGDGVYALDESKREQWMEIEDFPPYEIAVDEGEALFGITFSNGKSYASCFDNEGIGVKHNFPYFDKEKGEVITLALAINQCRELNDEKMLPYSSEEMGALSAYMAYTSRGKLYEIEVPPEGRKAYESGKQFFYERRGQLNFSCSSCHLDSAGGMLRDEILSATIGHATHWPTYRSKWGAIGSLHKRFAGCNRQVGAVDLPQQSESYRNLEYFLTYMNNGMVLNGPGSRK